MGSTNAYSATVDEDTAGTFAALVYRAVYMGAFASCGLYHLGLLSFTK